MEQLMINDKLYEYTKQLLIERGVDFKGLAKIVVDSQIKHSPMISESDALKQIDNVLKKREAQHAIITGIQLDILAEKNLIFEPLLGILKRDEGLYGIDEALAESIVNCYGSIAKTVFGYLDVSKPGVLKNFNQKREDRVDTFLDDLLSAICGAACSRYAHNS